MSCSSVKTVAFYFNTLSFLFVCFFVVVFPRQLYASISVCDLKQVAPLVGHNLFVTEAVSNI